MADSQDEGCTGKVQSHNRQIPREQDALKAGSPGRIERSRPWSGRRYDSVWTYFTEILGGRNGDEKNGCMEEGVTSYEQEPDTLSGLPLWKSRIMAMQSYFKELFERAKLGMVYSTIPSGRWWCVVIGIGEYSSIGKKLAGPAQDAEAMHEFLIKKLGIPAADIVLLKDKEATREKIISALHEHLLDNPKITRGDRQLIYFAGCGASYDISACIPNIVVRSGCIEAICPTDRGEIGLDNRIIYDISNREMNMFLRAVNEKWGPNNVIILDCCYAESATRATPISQVDQPILDTLVPRVAPPLPDAGQNMLKVATESCRWDCTSVADAEWKPDMETHVLLAACQAHEQASEINRRGVFTNALLSTLRDLEPGRCTWKEAIKKIPPLVIQTPHVEGRVNTRLWFQP